MATLYNALAVVLALAAAGALGLGATLLAHANDLGAVLALIIGIVALRAGVELVRPGVGHEH